MMPSCLQVSDSELETNLDTGRQPGPQSHCLAKLAKTITEAVGRQFAAVSHGVAWDAAVPEESWSLKLRRTPALQLGSI